MAIPIAFTLLGKMLLDYVLAHLSICVLFPSSPPLECKHHKNRRPVCLHCPCPSTWQSVNLLIKEFCQQPFISLSSIQWHSYDTFKVLRSTTWPSLNLIMSQLLKWIIIYNNWLVNLVKNSQLPPQKQKKSFQLLSCRKPNSTQNYLRKLTCSLRNCVSTVLILKMRGYKNIS